MEPRDDLPNAAIVGANVRRLRTAMRPKMSQEALAAAAGLSRSTIAAVEKGKYKSADMSTVARLASALGVGITEITSLSLGRGRLDDAVDSFLASPWFDEVKPTEGEIAWLKQLPEAVWSGAPPAPGNIARLVLWRRGSLH